MIFWWNAMKLTEKDRVFLERLRSLLEEKHLSIELKEEGLRRLVLKKNYGDRIEQAFGLTRQGVRWRFQRLFNEIYVHAYITICWVESSFGTELREKALAIARERLELQKRQTEVEKACFPKGRNPG